MELLDQFKKTIDKQILVYAASKQMFCKKCEAILDWKTTVVLDCNHETMGKSTLIICKKCYNENIERMTKRFKELDITVETTKL